MAVVFSESLAEGWIWVLPQKELKKTAFSESSSGWKSLYFYMTNQDGAACLTFFKKPKSRKDKPFDVHSHVQFQLHKKTGCNKHQTYICEVIDSHKESSYYAFENEGRRDSFAFFMMTQRRLPENQVAGKLFTVKPVNSNDHRKIGARGSVCLLHVCQSGISLAFEISRSIIAQWPLNSIRTYGASQSDQFQIEAGKRAPMGQGLYSFLTRNKENLLIDQALDHCISKAVQGTQSKSKDDKIYEEYCSLGRLACSQSHQRYSRDLQRISANNFLSDEFSATAGQGQDRNSSEIWCSDDRLSDCKISDVQDWVASGTSSQDHKLSSPLRESGQAALSGVQKVEKPPLPDSKRPGRHRTKEGIRGRSKTEVPLSLPSLPEPAGYMEMHSSVQSLNSSPDKKPKHLALTRTDREHSISPLTFSRSFDGLERRPHSTQYRVNSQSSVLSPLSLATPPPTFYEAMELPSYPAPTPPEDACRLSNASSTTSGTNVLALPLRRRPRRGERGTTGSCEDLTTLVRNSIVLTGAEEYENAMYNNELLHNFEMSGDHGAEGRLPNSDSLDAVDQGNTGTITRHTATTSREKQNAGGDKSDHDDTISDPSGGKAGDRHSSGPDHYNLAGQWASPPHNGEPESPRVTSTYLYEKEKNVEPSNSARVRTKAILPVDPHIAAVHGADANGSAERGSGEPPPIPDIPRPHILRKQPVSERSMNSDTRQVSTESQAGMSNRVLPEPNAVGCRDTISYEIINDNPGGDTSHSSTGTSSMASQAGVYEPVNEELMLENEGARHQPSTIWHVTLDGQPINQPLSESDKEHELALALEVFNKIEAEAEILNAEFNAASRTEENHHYLLPAKSPQQEVRLPDPPVGRDDSDEEAPKSLFGFGSVRKMFGEITRGKLRRTKSTDILGDGATAAPSCSPSAKSSQSKSFKHVKSKSSSKANNEFDVIKTSAKTKEFTRQPSSKS
ncbi:uncharacterized protein [Watersipora subatra]|uniref:uncharacterized protein isoform X2 n=1 Tax=Watersipora subatra TaxID=2589382 RepID=UPI00355C9BFA